MAKRGVQLFNPCLDITVIFDRKPYYVSRRGSWESLLGQLSWVLFRCPMEDTRQAVIVAKWLASQAGGDGTITGKKSDAKKQNGS
jgi:hypothetical protein